VTAALFYGAIVGLGLYAAIRVWLRPAAGVATLIHRIDSSTRSMSTRTVTDYEAYAAQTESSISSAMRRLGDRFEVLAAQRGWRLGRVRNDLGIMNRSVGSFLASKVVIGVLMLLIAPVLWSVLTVVGGLGLPPVLPAVAAVALGLFGFFIPDLALKGEAEERRMEFRRVVGIFLDLVSMNLAGGRGLPEALMSASTISEHWALVRIRQALANARLFGTTPWVALDSLGAEIGVEELRDLSAALTLAADDGAKIKQSLSARAATLRRREMADVEGEAGESSQSMLVAQLVLCFGFMVFLAYPALTQLSHQ
jgi:Flp pilus assembly protein TadB